MNRTVTYHITEADANMQILNFLRSKGFSRHILSSMKAEKNAISLNGEKAGGRTLLKNQDVLKILVPETGSTEHIIPVPMNLSVLYEDEDILAVDKPAGMPVHPSMGNYENTLANGSAFYFESKNLFCPFRCINRLDRDTSGALLLAKNPLSAAILSTQMKHRKIRRTYLAVVKGITPEKGKISAPIARLGDSVIQRCVDFDRGESAVTFYERLDIRNDHSLLELHLETGRTHQIRAHLAHIGCPILGDSKYGNNAANRELRFKYQALCAWELRFPAQISDPRFAHLAGRVFHAEKPWYYQQIVDGTLK
jgi:23S rRNA pseudouridine1911/1915/1917 synthase